jgi:hypothetical protein
MIWRPITARNVHNTPESKHDVRLFTCGIWGRLWKLLCSGMCGRVVWYMFTDNWQRRILYTRGRHFTEGKTIILGVFSLTLFTFFQIVILTPLINYQLVTKQKWGHAVTYWLEIYVTSRRSRIRNQMRLVNFKLPNPSRYYALRFTQSLTEMSTRSRKIIFMRSRARPVLRADNLTSICEPILHLTPL